MSLLLQPWNEKASLPSVRHEPEDTLNRLADAFCMSVSFSLAEWGFSSCPLVPARHPLCVTSILSFFSLLLASSHAGLRICEYARVSVSHCSCILWKYVTVSRFLSVPQGFLCMHKLTHVCTYLCTIILTVKAIAPNLPPQREYWY